MANSLSSLTAGVGGVQISSVDTSGSLDIKSGTTTIVSITSAGAAVTGTLSASGATTFPAGSAAAPAITTTGDTNTGIFFPAADTIAFSEGGTESMRIDSSGNVGIGITNPSSKLYVSGTGSLVAFGGNSSSNVVPDLQIVRSSSGTGIQTGPNITFSDSTANNTCTIQNSQGNLTFWNYGSATWLERMRLDSSGNLGIGTASPSEKLHVGGSIRADGQIKILGQDKLILGFDQGGGASLNYNGNGNLDITPRSGYNTVITAGNLLVGTTTASGKSSVSNNTNQTIAYLNADSGAYTADALYIQVATTSTNQYNFINCTRTGTAVKFLVKDTGNVQNANNSYGAISDIKLKENIVDTSPKLDKLLQVKIRNYNLKTDPDHKQIGVVAQELETIFPSLIEETEDRETVTKTREVEVPAVEEILDDEGNVVTPEVEATTTTEEYTEQVLTGETTKSVKYSVFVPILIKAMQEQQAMIDELKAEIELLKGVK
jgi:hypothetical protein